MANSIADSSFHLEEVSSPSQYMQQLEHIYLQYEFWYRTLSNKECLAFINKAAETDSTPCLLVSFA